MHGRPMVMMPDQQRMQLASSVGLRSRAGKGQSVPSRGEGGRPKEALRIRSELTHACLSCTPPRSHRLPLALTVQSTTAFAVLHEKTTARER